MRDQSARHCCRNWLTAQAIIFLAWLPGLVALVLAAQGDATSSYRWIPPSTWHHVWSVLSAVYLFRASDITTFELLPAAVPGLGTAILALALFGALRLKREPTLLSVIGIAFATMPAAMLIMSMFHGSWVPRYLLWSTGPLFVLAGIGVAALPRRVFSLAVAAVVIAGIANLVPYYRTETKPRWDLAAAYLAANAHPDDTIVANTAAATYMLGVYGDRYHLNHEIVHASDVARTAARLVAARARYGLRSDEPARPCRSRKMTTGTNGRLSPRLRPRCDLAGMF